MALLDLQGLESPVEERGGGKSNGGGGNGGKSGGSNGCNHSSLSVACLYGDILS